MLGEALRLIRSFHGLSQTQGAEKLGISKSYLSEIERGRKPPTLQLIERYAEVYQLPVSSILFFSENMERSLSYRRAQQIVSKKIIRILSWVEAGGSDRGTKAADL